MVFEDFKRCYFIGSEWGRGVKYVVSKFVLNARLEKDLFTIMSIVFILFFHINKIQIDDCDVFIS